MSEFELQRKRTDRLYNLAHGLAPYPMDFLMPYRKSMYNYILLHRSRHWFYEYIRSVSRFANFPDIPGVYIIYQHVIPKEYWDGKDQMGGCFRLIYIGSSESIKKRVTSHISFPAGRPFFSKAAERLESGHGPFIVAYKLTQKNGDWLMLEHRLIERLQPECNRRGIVTSLFRHRSKFASVLHL